MYGKPIKGAPGGAIVASAEPGIGTGGQLLIDRRRRNSFVGAKCRQPAHQVFKLANIAGPGMLVKPGNRLGR